MPRFPVVRHGPAITAAAQSVGFRDVTSRESPDGGAPGIDRGRLRISDAAIADIVSGEGDIAALTSSGDVAAAAASLQAEGLEGNDLMLALADAFRDSDGYELGDPRWYGVPDRPDHSTWGNGLETEPDEMWLNMDALDPRSFVANEIFTDNDRRRSGSGDSTDNARAALERRQSYTTIEVKIRFYEPGDHPDAGEVSPDKTRNETEFEPSNETPAPHKDPLDPELGGGVSSFARRLTPGYLRTQERERHSRSSTFGPGGFQSPDSTSNSPPAGAVVWRPPPLDDSPARSWASRAQLRLGRGAPQMNPGGRPPLAGDIAGAIVDAITRRRGGR